MINSSSIRLSMFGAALALGMLVGPLARANETYTVNETITGPLNGVIGNPLQTDSVIGTITTDGTIGTLHAGNLVGWNLDLVDVTNPQYSTTLTTVNSLIAVDSGDALSATSAGLFYNFAITGGFAFQAKSPGQFSGYHYWCLSENYYACASGNTIAPGNVYGGSPGDDLVIAVVGTQGQVGNAPLDSPSPVPEPAMSTLFAFGIVGVALAGRRRHGSNR